MTPPPFVPSPFLRQQISDLRNQGEFDLAQRLWEQAQRPQFPSPVASPQPQPLSFGQLLAEKALTAQALPSGLIAGLAAGLAKQVAGIPLQYLPGRAGQLGREWNPPMPEESQGALKDALNAAMMYPAVGAQIPSLEEILQGTRAAASVAAPAAERLATQAARRAGTALASERGGFSLGPLSSEEYLASLKPEEKAMAPGQPELAAGVAPQQAVRLPEPSTAPQAAPPQAEALGQGPGAPPQEPPLGTAPEPASFESARDKLVGLIKAAEPVREQTQKAYHQIRQEQADSLARIFAKGGGEDTLNKALGSLKGELPAGQFSAPADLMTSEEAGLLYSRIWETPELRPFERVQTGAAFRQLFSGGVVPTRSDLGLLERVFGSDFTDAVLAKRSLGAKAWEEILGVLGIPRALKSSIDLSAPLRQGAMLVGQPKEFGGALKDMFIAARSDESLAALDAGIKQNPSYGLLQRSKLYLAPLDSAATLSAREEAFATRLASKIPGIDISQRAYVGFLNSLRARTFYSYAEAWGDLATPAQYKKLATFINRASGRGTLGPLGEAAPVVAQAFFSPRYFVSRLQAPLKLAADNPLRAVSVSRVAARNLVAFVGTNVGLLSILKLSGAADVNLDPRSANFGKARIGNTRLDFFAGYLQIARATAMAMTGRGVTGATGRPYEANRAETLTRFTRSKLAPVPGAVANTLYGRDLAGDEIRWDGQGIRDQAGNLLAPMNVMDIVQAVQEHGAPGALFGVPSTFGVGVATYQAFATKADMAAARKAATNRLYPRQKGYGSLNKMQKVVVDASQEVKAAKALLDPLEVSRTAAIKVLYPRKRFPKATSYNALTKEQKDAVDRYVAGHMPKGGASAPSSPQPQTPLEQFQRKFGVQTP